MPEYLVSLRRVCNLGCTKVHPPAFKCSSCAQTMDSKLGYDSMFFLTLTNGKGWNCSILVTATSTISLGSQIEPNTGVNWSGLRGEYHRSYDLLSRDG